MILLTGDKNLKCFVAEALSDHDLKIHVSTSVVNLGLKAKNSTFLFGKDAQSDEIDITDQGNDDEGISVKEISIYNSDNIPHSITLKFNEDHVGHSIIIYSTTLNPKASLFYNDMRGFYEMKNGNETILQPGQFFEGDIDGKIRIVNSHFIKFTAPSTLPLDFSNVAISTTDIGSNFYLPDPKFCKSYYVFMLTDGSNINFRVTEDTGTINGNGSFEFAAGRIYTVKVNEDKTGYYASVIESI